MENEKKKEQRRVLPLKKRHVENLTPVDSDDTLEEARMVETVAKSSVVLDRSDYTAPGILAETGKGHNDRLGARNVSNRTYPRPVMERVPSTSSMRGILPMPPLLQSTTSWDSLLGAAVTDLMAPPFFDFATSCGQPLIAGQIFETPASTYAMPPADFGSMPPQFFSQPPGNHFLPNETFAGRKSTGGSLLADNLPQPTPLSGFSGMQMDESNVALALLNLTPAVPTRRVRVRVPFGEIGLQTASTHNANHGALTVRAAAAQKDSHGALTMRTRRLLENVPVTDEPCKCKNSKCLKLYCVCFQTGKFCDGKLCKCKQCLNTEQHNGPGGERSRVVIQILHRRMDAFEPRLKKKTGEGCSCKKNR
jgi:hypothetical protein